MIYRIEFPFKSGHINFQSWQSLDSKCGAGIYTVDDKDSFLD